MTDAIADLVRIVNDLNLDGFNYLQEPTRERADALAAQGIRAWEALQQVLEQPADPEKQSVIAYAKKAIQLSMDTLHEHPMPGVTSPPPPRHYDD